MSGKGRRISNVRIYLIQYVIFLFGAILAIVGMYMINIDGLAAAGFIFLSLGAVFVVLSYIYARYGARVIGTNCPFCYGKGYTDKGKYEPKEMCSVCDGTGKMYSKALQHLMEEEKKKEIMRENTSDSIESTEEEHN
ncbi:MAG: hypothetical protein KGD64_08505, partial [Candidatus Heimdallarchaeota archaeon]|nr:hypothetical protein [Candidatus Heimdallarchaeota archaeon]